MLNFRVQVSKAHRSTLLARAPTADPSQPCAYPPAGKDAPRRCFEQGFLPRSNCIHGAFKSLRDNRARRSSTDAQFALTIRVQIPPRAWSLLTPLLCRQVHPWHLSSASDPAPGLLVSVFGMTLISLSSFVYHLFVDGWFLCWLAPRGLPRAHGRLPNKAQIRT